MGSAFIFPGQGSQFVGMLSGLSENTAVRATFDEASAALDYDMWQLCQAGPIEKLSQTQITQPALLTAGVALWRAWQAGGGFTPDVMAGHSLGEYTALVCAQSLDFADAVRLVKARGEFMQAAVAEGEGAMAAILGLDDAAVRAACESIDIGIVAAVNFNAPGQVVIAGERNAVEAAIIAAKAAGAKRAMPLPVSVPSHCDLMRPAADQLRAVLAQTDCQQPNVPVLNNVDVAAVSDPRSIREALVRQLYSPVRWSETMQKIADAGVDTVMECGPGKVLSGLLKRIDKRLIGHNLDDAERLATALTVSGEDHD